MAHCDIKSSNILVKLNGDCCLSDFSLAVRCNPYVFFCFFHLLDKEIFSHTKDIQGGGIERLYHRVGTKLYMPPELLDKTCHFYFDRINAYQQGDMYSLALVLWEIGNCCCSITHIRPYENQLPLYFNIDDLIQLVCMEQKRPINCINTSDKVSRKISMNYIVFLFSSRYSCHFSIYLIYIGVKIRVHVNLLLIYKINFDNYVRSIYLPSPIIFLFCACINHLSDIIYLFSYFVISFMYQIKLPSM